MSADLLFRPVHELAVSVRSGEISARELVDASLGRIDALNPELNAFVDVFHDEALAAADAVKPGDDRPFAGVPIAIKNNRPVQGKRLTFAAAMMKDFVAPYDHNVVTRLRAAGFIIVGTTTLPEWGILPVSEGRYLGPTRNPWDTARTPGGSSGGSAAAVASGMVPIAHANDGGGSTRIPAACCGLVGLKPQRGRISLAPELGDNFLGIDGVLTRTVAETAQLLDVLAGPEPGDATWAPPPAEPFADTAGRDPGKLRIALSTALPLEGAELDPVCDKATRDAGELLASLGHEVIEADPPHGGPDLLRTFTGVFGPLVSMQIVLAEMVAGREATAEDMEALSWQIFSICKGMNALESTGAIIQLQAFARELVTWMGDYDVMITPALAEAPLPIGTLDFDGPDPLGAFTRSGHFTPYTAAFNVTGQPAVSVPLYQREDGLPLGVQLVGQPAGEGQLLALAAQLEQANPWADRRAPVGA
jgi:amidase